MILFLFLLGLFVVMLPQLACGQVDTAVTSWTFNDLQIGAKVGSSVVFLIRAKFGVTSN